MYRLVAKDDEPPWDPASADLVKITAELTGTDPREFVSGVRFYQVWRNTGSSVEQAELRQPRLHAEGVVVAPIQQLSLREDGGRVIGQWYALSGTSKVHVYRIPMEHAGRAGLNSAYELDTGDANLTGFIDREPVRGKRYLYRFYAQAQVNGVDTLSQPVGQPISVSALLSPVDDLSVRGHGDQDDWRFDLAWTPPASGKVVVYRTMAAPTAGLEAETRDESALPGAGLSADLRVGYPVQALPDGRTGMGEVPCPPDWDRVYFTPVTLLEGRARVGKTISQAVIPLPEEPVVVERTQHQLLKFGWPGKAASVGVSLGPPGAPATLPAEGRNYQEITHDAYDRLGGLQFPTRLPPHGCSVHLAGIAFVNRQKVYGAPAVTEYSGLLKLAYTIEVKRKGLGRGPERALIWLTAEEDLSDCPPFVLVHNPERLPLHARDGELWPVAPDLETVTEATLQFRPNRLGRQPAEVPYRATVRARRGFVRVFADLKPEMLRWIALMDPPVQSLTLPG